MAKLDYKRAQRERSLGRLSPPLAYRTGRSYGEGARRERLVSDIPPETRQEREDRLRYERKLAERDRMEEERRSRESGRKSSSWRDQNRQGAAGLQEQSAPTPALLKDEDMENQTPENLEVQTMKGFGDSKEDIKSKELEESMSSDSLKEEEEPKKVIGKVRDSPLVPEVSIVLAKVKEGEIEETLVATDVAEFKDNICTEAREEEIKLITECREYESNAILKTLESRKSKNMKNRESDESTVSENDDQNNLCLQKQKKSLTKSLKKPREPKSCAIKDLKKEKKNQNSSEDEMVKSKKAKKKSKKVKKEDNNSSSEDPESCVQSKETTKSKKGKKCRKKKSKFETCSPLTADYLKLIMKENLLSKKCLKKLIKATEKTKEKKLTVKISSEAGQNVQLSYSSKDATSDSGIGSEGVVISNIDKVRQSHSPPRSYLKGSIGLDTEKTSPDRERQCEPCNKRKQSYSMENVRHITSPKNEASGNDKYKSCETPSKRSYHESECWEVEDICKKKKPSGPLSFDQKERMRSDRWEDGQMEPEVRNQLPLSRLEEKLGRWVEKEILGRKESKEVDEMEDRQDKRDKRNARRKKKNDRRMKKTARREEKRLRREETSLTEKATEREEKIVARELKAARREEKTVRREKKSARREKKAAREDILWREGKNAMREETSRKKKTVGNEESSIMKETTSRRESSPDQREVIMAVRERLGPLVKQARRNGSAR